jgi:hypothetical protein
MFEPELIALIATIAIAVVGWLYQGRLTRNQSRKQHTFDVYLQTALLERYDNAMKAIRPYMRNEKHTPRDNELEEADREPISFLLNHLEFIAAGIRNGDLDEKLLKDIERGVYTGIFETFETYIFGLRDRRDRQAVYEHLEWLYRRWQDDPPGVVQQSIEWSIGRPLQGKRHKRS